MPAHIYLLHVPFFVSAIPDACGFVVVYANQTVRGQVRAKLAGQFGDRLADLTYDQFPGYH